MRQQNRGKNIAYLFYARAQVVLSQASVVALLCGAGSTGLITSAHAAAKRPPLPAAQNTATPETLQVLSFENLNPFTSVSVIRTNVVNNAYEKLTVTEKRALLTRSVGGFQKTLGLDEEFFKTLEQKIRAHQTVDVKAVKPVDGLKIELEIVTEDGTQRAEIDPVGIFRPVYAELMDIRTQVLTNAQ